MDNNPKQQTAERLKQASNILVTVSSNPSVDQLAACIGLTLLLNKIGKHATAVYSGATPSTIEFLKPEETLEKNTDSLRDFIIALDKSKADKLRYKVEDKIVRIFITPYHTSLTEKDLAFSLGDLNVEVIVALGVHQQAELDQAIMAHGRILHDATVISINTTKNNNLGNINWQDETASSLSELVAGMAAALSTDAKSVFDAQIATALLTGIVAATDRFSNNKTSAQTMSVSSQLIAAGANQQLVATKLEQPPPPPPPPLARTQPHPPKPMPPVQAITKPLPAPPKQSNDGTLLIDHNKSLLDTLDSADDLLDPLHQIEIDKEGILRDAANKNSKNSAPTTQPPLGPSVAKPNITGGSPFMTEPPALAGNPLDVASAPATSASPNNSTPDLNSARSAVDSAVLSSPAPPLKPIAALNALPVFDGLNNPMSPPSKSDDITSGVPPLISAPAPPSPAIQSRPVLNVPSPANQRPPVYDSSEDMPSGTPPPSPSEVNTAAGAPPPVPPPITPPVF